MTKHFCDACGKEKDTRLVEIPLHIVESNRLGYVDRDLEQHSRLVSFELCSKCYNLSMVSLFAAIANIKETS